VTGISAHVRKQSLVEDTRSGCKFTNKTKYCGSGELVLAHYSEHNNDELSTYFCFTVY